MKKVSFIRTNSHRHWVGDGFPVRSIFSYNDAGEDLSPFLLLDYAGPAEFQPTDQKRGVGEHPHRGFETVTIVYSGEVEHRDSSGGGGKIGPGDVQWMTAASGLVHEEYHGREYAKRGGSFEMIQLWVNLPKKHKMDPPRYQGITDSQILRKDLPDGAGQVRVIAGQWGAVNGPAKTSSPVNVWDLRLKAGARARFDAIEGQTTALFVLKGRVRFPDGKAAGEAELAVLEREGTQWSVEAESEATVLVLGGEPLGEPIVGYGPFVMNTPEEIRQAFSDFQSGKMGRLKD
jgi:quercetin 2,3-dioxygenase